VKYYKDRAEETKAFSNVLDTWLSGKSLCDRTKTVEKELNIPSRDLGRNVRTLQIRPKDTTGVLPAAIYFHGGGMASYSCFLNNFKTLGHLISETMNVVVFMVDFRNSVNPSKNGDPIGPFPAGLNDCVDALRWISSNHKSLNIYKEIVVTGESGGGNLSIATAMATCKEELISGLYLMCPFISGTYEPIPSKSYSSLKRNDGIILSSHSMESYARAYGDGVMSNALAWPSVSKDYKLLRYLQKVHIRLNEFDPLLDEGKEFAQKCLESGLSDVTCSVDVGTVHGTGSFFPSLVRGPVDFSFPLTLHVH